MPVPELDHSIQIFCPTCYIIWPLFKICCCDFELERFFKACLTDVDNLSYVIHTGIISNLRLLDVSVWTEWSSKKLQRYSNSRLSDSQFLQAPSKPTLSCSLTLASLQVDRSTAGGMCKIENVLLESWHCKICEKMNNTLKLTHVISSTTTSHWHNVLNRKDWRLRQTNCNLRFLSDQKSQIWVQYINFKAQISILHSLGNQFKL